MLPSACPNLIPDEARAGNSIAERILEVESSHRNPSSTLPITTSIARHSRRPRGIHTASGFQAPPGCRIEAPLISPISSRNIYPSCATSNRPGWPYRRPRLILKVPCGVRGTLGASESGLLPLLKPNRSLPQDFLYETSVDTVTRVGIRNTRLKAPFRMN